MVESDGSGTESDDPLPRDKGAVEEEGDVVVRGRARVGRLGVEEQTDSGGHDEYFLSRSAWKERQRGCVR